MSEAATVHNAPSNRLTFFALAFTVAALVDWALAGPFSDDLYPVSGALGIVAFGLGRRARRKAKSAGLSRWVELGAMIVGGLIGAAVIFALIGWGVSQLV
jgi:predicted Na+-dependent transporter